MKRIIVEIHGANYASGIKTCDYCVNCSPRHPEI